MDMRKTTEETPGGRRQAKDMAPGNRLTGRWQLASSDKAISATANGQMARLTIVMAEQGVLLYHAGR